MIHGPQAALHCPSSRSPAYIWAAIMPEGTSQFSIHEYARDGDRDDIVAELARGASVEARDPDSDFTPLMTAASSEKAGADILRLLIQHGANVNASAGDPRLGRSRQSLDTLRAMLAAQVEQSSDAAGAEQAKEVLDQADRVASLHSEALAERSNPLSLAVGGGDLEKIRALLDAGANVRYTRSSGYDVLIDAMRGRDLVLNTRPDQLDTRPSPHRRLGSHPIASKPGTA